MQGRTKSGKGRTVPTTPDRLKIRKQGRGALMGPTSGGNTTKFADHAVFKRAIGKSGKRDLEVSGQMLAHLGIVRLSNNAVTIGFLRENEHRNGLGNQARDQWFGLSSKDEAAVAKQAWEIMRARIAAD